MKFTVILKDPDALDGAIADAVREGLRAIAGISGEEREALFDRRFEAAQKEASNWFRRGGCVAIEVDTASRTARVCPSWVCPDKAA